MDLIRDADDQLVASRVSRAEALAQRLESEIVSSKLPPGERLGTKEELRRRFGVAVATLNETVRLMETKGLITARPGPGGGVFVTRPSVQDRLGRLVPGLDADRATLGDCVELRNALEPIMWRHALARHTRKDLKRLHDIVDEMERSLSDGHAYFHRNWRLHRSVADLCTNGPARNLYITLIDAIDEGFEGFDFVTPTPASIEVHRKLLDAVDSQDERRLATALREHAKRSPLPSEGAVGTAHGL